MNVDYDPFEGWAVQGKPRFTLSRGETVYADGKIVSEPGRGRFVKRSLFEPALHSGGTAGPWPQQATGDFAPGRHALGR